MEKSMLVPFNRTIQLFLAEENYTHVYNKGIASDKLKFKDSTDNDYIIIPLKTDDPLFNERATAERIEEIKSNDVYDMADGDPFIKFIVEVPVKLYEKYLKG